MARAFVGVGSNVGDREAHLARARAGLASLPDTQLVGWSRVYETDPVGPVAQARFLNAAAELATTLGPRDLLAGLRGIEREAGREPGDRRVRWGPRTLDLDILLYDDLVLQEADLVVPHPRMHERAFVLRPLVDLDPGVLHPALARTAAELLRGLRPAGSRDERQA